jgi:aryl-alcohol dehydrogenase-like predicted oxidoreductase
MEQNFSNLSMLPESMLRNLDPFVFGSMLLGRKHYSFEDRLAMAHYAVEHCQWFHTSLQYGETFDVLATVFRENPSRKPKCIFKLSGSTLDEIRRQIDFQLKALDMDQIHIGQVHFGGALAADFIAGGKCLDSLRQLRAEGLVGALTLEVHPWTSWIALGHLRSGEGRDIIEGFSFYFNPLQRFALNELFDWIIRDRRPILALRTMAGGPADRQADRPAREDDYLQKRSAEILSLYQHAGYDNWADFAINFAFSQPGVICTIGSCSTPAHLDECLAAVNQPAKPFHADLFNKILEMQTRWSLAKDVFAPEWSM